ncbi:MAG: molybdate ABC transporter substrate-binding protein [Gemmatimonadota bacterium]
MQFDLLSAGAAQGLVGAIQEQFTRESGCALNATFGAVGAMLEKFDAGAPADAIILTRKQIDALAQAGRVRAESVVDLGVVRTGVALKDGAAAVSVATADALRAALRAAAEIHFPDPQRATAGIHFARVVDALGIRAEIESRLRPHPNGATAMRALAASPQAGAIGCTQKTEILATPGVRWIGALPQEFELATVYASAVAASARSPRQAAELLALLGGAATRELRRRLGFEER